MACIRLGAYKLVNSAFIEGAHIEEFWSGCVLHVRMADGFVYTVRQGDNINIWETLRAIEKELGS